LDGYFYDMPDVKHLRKGLNIRIKGVAEKVTMKMPLSATISIKPSDYFGFVPRLAVKPGDRVRAGDKVLTDKNKPEISLTSPVSGVIKEIIRAERRELQEVIIAADKEIEYKPFTRQDVNNVNRDMIIQALLDSGLWPVIKQRPFNLIADPAKMPRDIFISGFDTAPLAPDIDYLISGYEPEFLTGIDALAKLTAGRIHLSVDGRYPVPAVYSNCRKLTLHEFTGPHPAGNTGVQIHHIAPINKGEIVWTIHPQDVILVGRFFMKAITDTSRLVALTGPVVKRPMYFKVISGSSIAPLIAGNITEENVRYISGNVLTGRKISLDGHLGFSDVQITVIPEGNYHELLGWASPGFNKFSASRTFWSWLSPDRKYVPDTNLHGGRRAFVFSGQYESVLPMDILPVHLLKAILAEDIDQIENLGIYEVVEEDLALCEYVCTSKIEVQQLLRKGINLIIKEIS